MHRGVVLLDPADASLLALLLAESSKGCATALKDFLGKSSLTQKKEEMDLIAEVQGTVFLAKFLNEYQLLNPHFCPIRASDKELPEGIVCIASSKSPVRKSMLLDSQSP